MLLALDIGSQHNHDIIADLQTGCRELTLESCQGWTWHWRVPAERGVQGGECRGQTTWPVVCCITLGCTLTS